MKLGFFGTPPHSARLLNFLLEAGHEISFTVTNLDKPFGRDKVLTPSPVKQLAQSKSIPVLQYQSIKKEEAAREILSYDADLYIVFAYGSIIPRQIFAYPRGGTINLHGSLLPEFRGASPVQAAILAGYTETGMSLQYIVEELDAGDIIASVKEVIFPEDNFGTVLDRLTIRGTELLLQILQTYNGQRFASTPQDHSKASFCSKIKPEDRKLDFTISSHNLHNRIRAFNPGNICFCNFRGKRVNIYRTRISPEQTSNLPPGSFYRIDKKTPGIVTADSRILVLEELQLENKKVMAGLDFMNGMRPENGELFQ